jgi:membrane protein required for colicin V production
MADLLGRAVRATPFGGLDRALGVVFGVVRGAAILVAAYVVAGLAAPPSEWPSVVKQARATPLAYQGAVWAAGLVPQAERPHVAPLDAPPALEPGGKTI